VSFFDVNCTVAAHSGVVLFQFVLIHLGKGPIVFRTSPLKAHRQLFYDHALARQQTRCSQSSFARPEKPCLRIIVSKSEAIPENELTENEI